METYDFSGYATRNDLTCSDGRVIRKNAFAHCDGKKVPVCWNHEHDDPSKVLGYAILENREDGVYAYGSFNDTPNGRDADALVKHGDVTGLSIYANQLRQNGNEVLHGEIRELSLVLAGANPGAFIDFVVKHSDDGNEIEEIYANYDERIMVHSSDDIKKEEPVQKDETKDKDNKEEDAMPADKTVGDVFEAMTEEQKSAVYFLIGQALENAGVIKKTEEDSEMKHNVFDNDSQEEVLAHSEMMANALSDAKKYGSLRDSVIAHAEASGITNYDFLLPEPESLNTPPEWIKKPDDWVSKIMHAVHHTPFSRVKSMFAQLDEVEARARGYIKGNMKKELALSVLKRTTLPTTVYIKMKMDRDDIIDITDFDVVAWQRAEMRSQLDKELARAMLLGDGRDLSSDDKINEQNIRPVLTDDDMYTIKYTVTDGTDYNDDFNSASANDSEAKGIIRAAVKSRKEYKGSGNPTFFTTEEVLTNLLLIEDQNGRRIYESEATLATAMRVREIVTIPEMELAAYNDIYGIIVNMADYNTGADKGGAVSMFDDFDIDYNQQKYLMETRMSGALVRPYSAIVLKKDTQ